MGVFDTYAKRKKMRERSGQPDVYTYDRIPSFLRKQIGLILRASLGPWDQRVHYSHVTSVPCGNPNWVMIAQVLEREVSSFPDEPDEPIKRCLNFLDQTKDVDEWLSFVEIACRLLEHLAAEGEAKAKEWYLVTQAANDALEEINQRFRENAFGYQYENGEFVRVDDQFIHAEIIKPALQLLTEVGFEKANEEFMTAHRHYRSGHVKDAIVAANRAFEATLKAICKLRSWEYPSGARAADLITTVRKKGLLPAYLDEGLNTYVAMMKTGLPGVRNNAGGHGEDPEAPTVPIYLAAYAIHLTAANILLMITANKSK